MEQKKLRNDILSSLIFLVLSCFLYLWIIPSQVKISTWNTAGTFHARTFPNLVSGIIFLTALAGLVKSSLQWHRLRKETTGETTDNTFQKPGQDLWSFAMPFFMTAISLAYYYLFSRVGYSIATALLVPGILGILRCKKWQYYLYTELFGLAILLIFEQILKVQLP